MAEPVVNCPKCGCEIKLTESLAAPLVLATRQHYERQLAAKDAEVAERADALRTQEAELARQRAAVDESVRTRIEAERGQIVQAEAQRAKLALGGQLEAKARENAELVAVLAEREAKLREAQQAQADAMRKERELEDARRELDLTIAKRVQEDVAKVREQARGEATEEFQLKLRERETMIDGMKSRIEELNQRIEQGSQQLQGEVQELELEAILAQKFLHDTIAPVPKGEYGGDVLQRVCGPTGVACGTILWESKRTKHWSDQWLPKLRADQRAARAELAVLVSTALPKDVEAFDLVDHVWVAHPRVALPLATLLRQSLVELASVKLAGEGMQTKTELVYQYLTGAQFQHRVQAIIEAFTSMQDDLQAEKKSITRQWAKREMQIEHVIGATAGMWGDLQGIAGAALPKMDGLALPADERADAPLALPLAPEPQGG